MRRKQGGFSAILAVVLLVLFGLIGTYLATMSGLRSASTTVSRDAIQAWFAAQSGLEWAVYQATRAGAHPAPALGCAGVGPPFGLGTAAGGQFAVAISCTFTPFIEGANTVNVYSLTSTASRGVVGELGFVTRTVRASVSPQ